MTLKEWLICEGRTRSITWVRKYDKTYEVNVGCLPFPTDKRTNNNRNYYKIYFVIFSIYTAVSAIENICNYGSRYYMQNVT
jgi:hypothetical protein